MAEKAQNLQKEKRFTPLGIISLFLGLAETVLVIAVTKVDGNLQMVLTIFVILFPALVAISFFVVLWNRPWVFYSPSEYGAMKPEAFVDTLARAQLGKVTTKTADLPQDVEIVGNPDQFVLLFKAAGKRWRKSTKAMDIGTGCVVQVSTEIINADGSVAVAEAVTFVPGAAIANNEGGNGKRLISSGGDEQ